MKQKLSFLCLMAVLAVTLIWQGAAGVVASDGETDFLSHPIRTTYITYDPDAEPGRFVPPPAGFGRSAPTANIEVNYIGSWPTEAQTAFEYAVTIWEQIIVSSVTIYVDAEFKDLGNPFILGGAGSQNYFINFPNAPMTNVWYPSALANSLAGTDLDGPAISDIGAEFNSTFDWYYGTDGVVPFDKVDFVSVVLHEIGHGLGFSGSMTVQGDMGYWGSGTPFPDIYDKFTVTATNQPLTDYPSTGSTTLAAHLTGDNIYFNGPNTLAANGGNRAKLYAPSTWQQGSSYSHLDEIYNGTPHALMTYALGSGQAEHDPGTITLGIFQDMGWQINAASAAEPTLEPLPSWVIEMNDNKNNVIDLWAYANDEQSADNELIFTITSQTDAGAGVSIDSNRYIDINPVGGWTGTSTITVEVRDPQNNTDTQSFTVTSITVTDRIYLPTIIR